MIRILKKYKLFVLVLLFTFPVLFSTLYKDDIVHGIYYYRESGNVQVAFDDVMEDISRLLKGGRFLPVLSFLGIFTFHFINYDSYLLYKILQYLFLTGTYILFIRFMKERVEKKDLIMLIFLLLAQTAMDPTYHDPYLSYNFLMPVVSLFLLGSLFLFNRFLEKNKSVDIVCSLILYLCALLTYEISYAFLIIYFLLLIYRKPWSIGIWGLLALIAGLMVFLQKGIRVSGAQGNYSGNSFSIEPAKITVAFLHQSFASIPLSRFWGRCLRFFFVRTQGLHSELVLSVLFIVALGGHFVIKIFKLFKERKEIELLSLIGMLVWLLPAIPIALSAKYQGELNIMRGYLPRYLQNIGFILYISPYVIKFRGKKYNVATITAGLFMISTFAYNIERIEEANREFYGSRILFFVLEDQEYLEKQGIDELFIIKSYAYWTESYLPLNSNVLLIDEGIPKKGEAFLFIADGNRKEAHAFMGIVEDNGQIENLHKIVYKKTQTSENRRLKDWIIEPVAESVSLNEIQILIEG